MASGQIQALRQVVTIQWPKHQRIEGKKLLLRTAREGHAKIMHFQTGAAGGAAPGWDAYANTPGNTNLDSVKLPGPIVYRYYYLREVILGTINELYRASPVVSGAYRTGHRLFLDGVPYPFGDVPAVIRPNQEIIIANLTPYARRLEVGLTESGRPFVIQVEPRIYERVMKRVLLPRYRQVATLSMTYIEVPPAWIIKGKLPPSYIGKGGVRKRRRQQVGAPVLSPAIQISLKGE